MDCDSNVERFGLARVCVHCVSIVIFVVLTSGLMLGGSVGVGIVGPRVRRPRLCWCFHIDVMSAMGSWRCAGDVGTVEASWRLRCITRG